MMHKGMLPGKLGTDMTLLLNMGKVPHMEPHKVLHMLVDMVMNTDKPRTMIEHSLLKQPVYIKLLMFFS